MRLLESLADRLHGTDGQMRILLDELRPEIRRPGKSKAFGCGGRSAGIIRTLQRLCKSKEVAGMDDAHDDLLTVLGDLGHLQPPVEEQEKACGSLTLLENSIALRHAPRRRMGEHPVQICVAHPVKQGKGPYDTPVDLHFAFPTSGFLASKPTRP